MRKNFFEFSVVFMLAVSAMIFCYMFGTIFYRGELDQKNNPVIIPLQFSDSQVEKLVTPEPTPEPITPCYTEQELIQVAKFLYQEARGIKSDTQVACVAWVVCNRVDGGYGDNISAIWGYPQIYYSENVPVTDRMYRIAKDVLDRWSEERATGTCEWRVLPPDYFWYTGDGKENYFRNVFSDYKNVWNYSLFSPYDN